MLKYNKRAIMGIGTLIIFIATILVAAVAAGVLISTSGVLQQRALITGQEARKKITNSIEIISITARGNKTDESLNNFEVLIRLDAGSDPIQMKKFDLTWIGPDHDAPASLADESLNSLTEYGGFNEAVGQVDNNSWTYIRDLDGDNVMERVMVHTNFSNFGAINTSNSSYPDWLIFNFSSTDADYFIYNLSANLGVPNATLFELEDIAIYGQDGLYYGYFMLDGNASDNEIPANMTFNISLYASECDFALVPPENKYCIEVMHGDSDLVLGDGEVMKLYFRLLSQNRMYIGQEFRFIFSSEKGRLSQAQARTPDVITTLLVPLWPVG